MPEKPSYVPLMESTCRTLLKLSPDQCQDLLRVIVGYWFNAIEPEGDGLPEALFELIRPLLDGAITTLKEAGD